MRLRMARAELDGSTGKRGTRPLPAGLVALIVVAGLGACRGSSADTDTAVPTPTTARVPRTALDLSKIPNADGIVTTAAPVTVAPTTTIGAETTAQSPASVPVTSPTPLPPGVTEADRVAVEAAAKAWWEEVDRMADNLPAYDPNALLAKAVPGSADAMAIALLYEGLSKDGYRSRKGAINQTEVLGTEFRSPTRAELEVCTADDGAYITALGQEEDSGLAGGIQILTFARRGDRWLFVQQKKIRQFVGAGCDA